ncbi:nucleotidyltransferase family protein [bacterium]|nr:nucleotidyltransferase family protein [bacterium]
MVREGHDDSRGRAPALPACVSPVEADMLGLLARALAPAGPGPEAPAIPGGVTPGTALVQACEAHKVTPLVYDELAELAGGDACDEGSLPPWLVTARTRARQSALQLYRLTFLTADLTGLLARAGARSVVLKGSPVAALYPVPEARKSGDVDVLLLDPSRLADADAALRREGFVPDVEQLATHHRSYQSPAGIEVELHVAIAEPFDDERVNARLAALQADMAGHVTARRVLGHDLPVLEDGYQALSLLLHMLQHFVRAGFGLKLLCDWVVFWNRDVAPDQVDLFERAVGDLGIGGFSGAVTGVCRRWLGLRDTEVVRRLEDAARDDDALCEALLEEVLAGGEFGHSSRTRMVVLRGTSPVDYLREFHHQTRLNFPRASRVAPAWPALWAVTLARFLRNNRTVRGVTLRSVLRETHRRSALTSGLGLFRRR